ncbi:DUF2612 domain-containing protein [Entomobacter blattae]|uniref:DUF2612 domain-containing protein n=1 Tax=Entomobacter blattae TaxID=2762277 RepID=A0A7H1NR83_9PROT|nr:DUF2612 domain-containing protein [Entomobacter blattae]QNT78293.1 hypothetical protein JGUZn3_10650 [Entomobacter blattae]
MMRYHDTVIAQYANAPVLNGLLGALNAESDPRQFWEEFVLTFWDIETAQGYGLDIWGKIVGVERAISSITTTWFGFQEETTALARPFGQITGQGVFWDGMTVLSHQTLLSDDDYRGLILAKAAANISDGSIASLNAILSRLFAQKGRIYLKDNRDMSLTVVTEWEIGQNDLALLKIIIAVLRPAGVEIVVEIAFARASQQG